MKNSGVVKHLKNLSLSDVKWSQSLKKSIEASSLWLYCVWERDFFAVVVKVDDSGDYWRPFEDAPVVASASLIALIFNPHHSLLKLLSTK